MAAGARPRAREPRPPRSPRRRLLGRPRMRHDDVLDGQAGLAPQPLHEVAPKPAGPLAAEGRDDDLVHALVARRLHGGCERVGVCDLAVCVDAGAAQRAERAPQALLGLGVRRIVALWRDDQEARAALLVTAADPLQEGLADDGLVG